MYSRLEYTCAIYTRKQQSCQSPGLVAADLTNIWLPGITAVGNSANDQQEFYMTYRAFHLGPCIFASKYKLL